MIANLFIDGFGRLRSGWRFLLALITMFVALAVSEIVADAFGANAVIRNMISRPLGSAILFAVFVWLAGVVDHAPYPAEYIGLGTRSAWARDFGVGCALGGALVAVCIAAIAMIGGYQLQGGQPLAVSRVTATAIVAWILLFGALMEELALRSYSLFRLRQAIGNGAALLPWRIAKVHADLIGTWIAILVLAVLFGSLHFTNPNVNFAGLGNTVLIGVFFGLLMVRTGSLWLLWGVHFGWNFTLGALFGLPVSGINQFSVLWTGRAEGPTWLTGGAYGIEASATASVLVLLAIIVVAWLPRRPSTATPAGIQPE